MTLKTTLIAAALVGATALPALADDIDVVRSFYADLLTTPGDVTPDQVRAVIAEDWVTTPAPLGGTGAEGFITTLGVFGDLIPDLAWEPVEIYRDGDTYIVRGRATGTPVGPFLGVDPATGNSFEIMSIDIHTVVDGRIANSYHIEDWSTAAAQLAGQ